MTKTTLTYVCAMISNPAWEAWSFFCAIPDCVLFYRFTAFIQILRNGARKSVCARIIHDVFNRSIIVSTSYLLFEISV